MLISPPNSLTVAYSICLSEKSYTFFARLLLMSDKAKYVSNEDSALKAQHILVLF